MLWPVLTVASPFLTFAIDQHVLDLDVSYVLQISLPVQNSWNPPFY